MKPTGSVTLHPIRTLYFCCQNRCLPAPYRDIYGTFLGRSDDEHFPQQHAVKDEMNFYKDERYFRRATSEQA
ncbi:MAG: hypothetical protein PUB41_01415, partial [bacterium]|nr:hypothetical protein [bacterium]